MSVTFQVSVGMKVEEVDLIGGGGAITTCLDSSTTLVALNLARARSTADRVTSLTLATSACACTDSCRFLSSS